MSQAADRRNKTVARATALAQEFAPDLDSVILTHYPDADTLDLFRPGETDLDTAVAVNRAVAAALVPAGVRVIVQRADRVSFRRWMDGRIDTPASRLGWRDRGRLLHGPAALEALGLDPKIIRPRPKLGSAPGPLADRLMRAFADEEGAEFDTFAHELLAADRHAVLDLAERKVRDRLGEDAAEDLIGELLAVAEGAPIGPSGWAELVALPVALPPGTPPDAAAMGEGLVAAGVLPDGLEVRFLPGWRSPEAIAALHPAAIRRVLVDLLAAAEPRDLPPADTDSLAESGFGVLLGLQVDWTIPAWDEVAANGPPEDPEEGEETPEDAARAALFDRWRTAVFEVSQGCVPLALVPPSEVEAEIADFLNDAREQTGGIEEIRAFVAMARREAPDEEVVCRPEVVGDGLELALYTRSGRFLDSLSLSADQLPARAEEMPRLIETFVPLVKDAPGR